MSAGRSSCSHGKVRYRSKKEALAAMRRVQRRFPGQKVPVRAYECDQCSGWHLSSKREWH